VRNFKKNRSCPDVERFASDTRQPIGVASG
jgi:hypothetical protein